MRHSREGGAGLEWEQQKGNMQQLCTVHCNTLPCLEVDAVVGGLGDAGQLLPGRRGPHEAAPAPLRHPKVARRQHARAHLRAAQTTCVRAALAMALHCCSHATGTAHAGTRYRKQPTRMQQRQKFSPVSSTVPHPCAAPIVPQHCTAPGTACPACCPWRT